MPLTTPKHGYDSLPKLDVQSSQIQRFKRTAIAKRRIGQHDCGTNATHPVDGFQRMLWAFKTAMHHTALV